VRRTGALAGTAVLLGALLAALAVVQWAGRDRAVFGAGSFDAVERAVQTAGLRVCRVVDEPDGFAGTSVDGRAYEVAVSCPDDTATVVVDRFASAADRDAAARQFEGRVRPRGSGSVRTLGDATVLLQGTGDGDVRQRLAEALRAEGAR
jgi:hypothetical protein